jgi:hypothetical protein
MHRTFNFHYIDLECSIKIKNTETIIMLDPENGIGDRFQQETKYYPNKIPSHRLDWYNKPESYKEYEKNLKTVQLPDPEFNEVDLWGSIYRRRSKREYITNKPISLQFLSILLWATQGITADFEDISLRTTPSAGALYPIETYLSVRLIEGLEPGIYHFRPYLFDLAYLKSGDYSNKLAKAALNQDMIESAQVEVSPKSLSIYLSGFWPYSPES